jgi:hypothetical protein
MQGTIEGLILIRHFRRLPLVTGVMVRLDDGDEVRAQFDLEPMVYVGREYFHLGRCVELGHEAGTERLQVIGMF